MTFKVKYPRDGTKVTNPDIKFQWNVYLDLNNQPVSTYLLEVFRLEGTESDFKWVKIIDKKVKVTNYHSSLEQGYIYHCRVRPYGVPFPVIPLPDPSGSTLSAKIRLVSDRFARLPRTQKILPGCSIFYVKPKINYLSKYFESTISNLKEGEHLGPTIPLLFYYLERYLYDLDDKKRLEKRMPLDDMFARAMDRQSPEFKDPAKLKKVLNTYKNINKEIKNRLFGDILPKDLKDETWIPQAYDEIIKNIGLEKLKIAPKKNINISLRIAKNPNELLIRNMPIDADIKFRIDNSMIGRGRDFIDKSKLYILTLKAKNGDSVNIPLKWEHEKKGESFLILEGIDLNVLDSAEFDAELWSEGPSGGDSLQVAEGSAQVGGGFPTIIGLEPQTGKRDRTDKIEIKVINGGGQGSLRQGRIHLRNSNAHYQIWTQSVYQEMYYEIYNFDLSGNFGQIPDPGEYDLTFENCLEHTESVNSRKFYVDYGSQYLVNIPRLQCIDESNPEKLNFGFFTVNLHDTISFQVFPHTAHYIHQHTTSDTYGGFDDGDIRDFYPFQYIIYPLRIIEDYLAIDIAIYEHDDLGWLGDLLNFIIDLIQYLVINLIAGAINAITGIGGTIIGWIVEEALDASGLNDIRRRAVNSMVSSWEVEVLSQGLKIIYKNELENIDTFEDFFHILEGSDSKYKIWFNVIKFPY